MKTLFVLRHAKAEPGNAGAVDFDRRLTARGRDAAAALGRTMHKRGIEPDVVLASPARRVAETVAGLERGFGKVLHVREERVIYEASTSALMRLLHGSDDGIGRLMLVGHNPGLHNLVLTLAADDAASLARFPTCALAEIQLEVEQWRAAEAGSGKLIALRTPGEAGGSV